MGDGHKKVFAKNLIAVGSNFEEEKIKVASKGMELSLSVYVLAFIQKQPKHCNITKFSCYAQKYILIS